MKENKAIFLVGGDAPVYLAEPMYKQYSATFVWGQLVSTYASHDQSRNMMVMWWLHRAFSKSCCGKDF